MTKYAIEDTTLVSISDALREKLGTTNLIDPVDYAALIRTLNTVELTNEEIINLAVTEGSLDSITWSGIKRLSNALVAGDINRNDVSGLLGLSKSFTYAGSTCYAFIIGIMQDYLDTTPRGFTFWCVGSNTPFSTSQKALHITTSRFGNDTYYVGGWGGGAARKDILRTALQPGGTIYSNMPPDIKAVMNARTTYYGPTYNSTTTDVSTVTDTMFILSEKELANANSAIGYKRPWWQYEGAGAAHNEQYQLFANEGIVFERNSNQDTFTKLACSTSCWLRTGCTLAQTYVMRIAPNGDPTDYYRSSEAFGICPCFCV